MVRPLSNELQKIAVEELHEDPKRVEDDIKYIQEWIRQQPYLNAPTDRQWILGFLRGCKFSLQTTKEKFDMYYTAITLMPELLTPRDIHSVEIQTLFKSGMVLPLPYFKNYQGPRIILIRFKDCDTNIINMENLTAFFYMIVNILMIEDDNFIVSGVLFWFDMRHLPLGFLFQCTPTYMKNHLYCLQSAFPLRIKGIHATGSPALGEMFFNLFKAFMGPKLRDRLVVYSENKFENVFQVVPEQCMPKEYGGENSNLDEIGAYWAKKVESYSTWFEESKQYTTNEALRPRKPGSLDEAIGTEGSFRMLNID